MHGVVHHAEADAGSEQAYAGSVEEHEHRRQFGAKRDAHKGEVRYYEE